ncbi:hypothetical protein BDR03DRAFT_988027 [Suillus americanus]|nr:hypothetical protein BDR03DRAFT_988027 [Suillus americanus]
MGIFDRVRSASHNQEPSGSLSDQHLSATASSTSKDHQQWLLRFKENIKQPKRKCTCFMPQWALYERVVGAGSLRESQGSGVFMPDSSTGSKRYYTRSPDRNFRMLLESDRHIVKFTARQLTKRAVWGIFEPVERGVLVGQVRSGVPRVLAQEQESWLVISPR